MKYLPAYIINSEAKKIVCIVAGIHGNEQSGINACEEFVQNINRREIQIPSDIKAIILPIANSYGFMHSIRTDVQRKDINRHFLDKPLPISNKQILETIQSCLFKDEKISVFLSLHDDLTANNFYMYDQGKEETKLDKEIITTANRFFPINRSSQICWDRAKNGIVYNIKDGSLEQLMFNNGVKYSICTEVPGRKPFQTRIDASKAIIKTTIEFVDCV